MTSITWWNRLEPRPRSANIDRALAAEIRDPLWMLTRQWQVGEFQGEDAASPVELKLTTRAHIATAWRPGGHGGSFPYDPLRTPVEKVFQEEPLDPDDLTNAADLGLFFEDLLFERAADSGVDLDDLVVRLRAEIPLRDDGPSRAPQDERARDFIAVCGGRLLDGAMLLKRVRTEGARARAVFPGASLTDAERSALEDILRRFGEEGPTALGAPWATGRAQPPAWRQEALRQEAELLVATDDGPCAFAISPDRDGLCDTWNFTLAQSTVLRGGARRERAMSPANVRFRGMPNARWWDFEQARTDFGAVVVDRRDLARMAVLEFMLVHGNDWFILPFSMHVGTLCAIERLAVVDVFGRWTTIPSTGTPGAESRWTMFSTSDGEGAPSNFFHLPASASAARMDGPVIEEVQWLRDEMANLAWAIEHTVPTCIGEPLTWRDRPSGETGLSAPATPPPGAPSLVWKLQSAVPTHWYPLLPTHAMPGGPDVVLRLGSAVLGGAPPTGRLLEATDGRPPAWREEEIPREGVRVVRRWVRTRWIDGSTHVWMMRARQVGGGEGASGLRFDEALFRSIPEASNPSAST